MIKPSIKDHASILLALLTVFVCGFGAGHVTGSKRPLPKPEVGARWEEETFSILTRTLDLNEDELQVVNAEIDRAATGIRLKRDETILGYHEEVSALYGRLIKQLDGANAEKLKEEKKALDEKIKSLRPST
ncbi:hypothetical protein [Luteolibacter luteus]|uniref:Uncharacterized protein n=1 Tax=Luteolibacter luteus TaxID=2728835 RepID=A0A858RB94_9BACT|nr:hypothetical protein [Luteolibacter luteus]QJE94256.1 hypothetical protein HHL09_00135 [Luteolibacter luteus]